MAGDFENLAPLILVVGPSGVGKDALILGAGRQLAQDHRFHFARRIVTRPSQSGAEDHDSMTVTDFRRREAEGGFLLSWDAHGLSYGLPREIAQSRTRGIAVVANVSRRVLDSACRELAPVCVLAVTAPAEILAARLAARGRESDGDILVRLQRSAPALPEGAVEVANDVPLPQAINRFVAALKQCHPICS
jgi:phosphonate metabolism protein PhnN/1,5-bisphosphokinase (PRPP-forming)